MIIEQAKLMQLCIQLMSCKSITPINDGAIEIIESVLSTIGFNTHKLVFADTSNIYAKIGNNTPNLCFAGHTDVVPTGDLNQWITPPFEPRITNNILYGRGTVDMKAAICAFIIATEHYIKTNNNNQGSISLMITGDEEASGQNGTPKILEWLQEKDEKIDACVVGEPTSNKQFGDMIKIGRRGSITFKLEIIGKQGHIAYPHLAINPIRKLITILHKLQNYTFDQGNSFFQPSNCEVTTIDVGNTAGNVIPEKIKTQFNIRFNDLQTAKGLEEIINSIISSVENTDYVLTAHASAHPFITKPGFLTDTMTNAIHQELKFTPEISTSGGTSDARHIKDICPVIEFGLLNSTAHKINESSSVQDIYNLSKIYHTFIKDFFLFY